MFVRIIAGTKPRSPTDPVFEVLKWLKCTDTNKCWLVVKFFILSGVLGVLWKQNSDKLEKLQERALRFVFSDYTSPYNDLLNHGNFLFLSALRIRYLAIEMYKCVYGIYPPYLNE